MSDKQNGLSEKAEAAFQEITAAVVRQAKQTGTPIVVWQDGQIKEIPCEDIEQQINRQTPNLRSHPQRPTDNGQRTTDE